MAARARDEHEHRTAHRIGRVSGTVRAADPVRSDRWIAPVVVLVSACVLVLQVALTRILSFVGYYHHVFLVVSSVMLGLGLGGFLQYLRSAGRTGADHGFPAPEALAGLALGVPACLVACLLMPGGTAPIGYILALTPPFLCAGMFLAAAYAHPRAVPRAVYAADLGGAALGCVAVVVAVRLVGAVNTVLLLGAISGAVAAAVSPRRGIPAFTAAVSLGLWALNSVSAADIALLTNRNHPKTLFQALREPTRRIVATAWSVAARTDLVEDAAVPYLKRIYTDGGNSTVMLRWDGTTLSTGSWHGFIGLFPFRFPRVARVACIGSGGGLDVVAALAGGAHRVDAVEINPDIVEFVRRDAAFNGSIYAGHPAVAVHVEEGRVFMRRPGPAYDLILLSLVLTPAPQGVSYALVENYVYTIEAFDDYLRRLATGGRLVIIEQSLERSVRQFATGCAALVRRGIAERDAPRHMAIFTVPAGAGEDGPDAYRNVFVLRTTPFSADEGNRMLAAAQDFGLAPVYVPHVVERGPYAALVSGAVSLEGFIAGAPFNIRPCTDDSPFFFNFGTGTLRRLEGVVPLTLAVVILLLGGMLAPQVLRCSGVARLDLPWSVCGAALGMGYLMVEVTLVQQCMLFLGTPTYAFTVVLFSLLLGSGIGCALGPRVLPDDRRRAIIAAAVVTVALIGLRGIPDLFRHLLFLGAPLRGAVAATIVFALGVVMGMPFPAIVTMLRHVRPGGIAWLWGINGIAAVAGSLLATIGAMEYGYAAVQSSAALLYLLTAGVIGTFSESRTRSS